jgi:hypothetical protein
MTDQPVREPIPPDAERDRADGVTDGHEDVADANTGASIRPSKADGAEEDGGPRPPRPSQAEGERDDGAP